MNRYVLSRVVAITKRKRQPYILDKVKGLRAASVLKLFPRKKSSLKERSHGTHLLRGYSHFIFALFFHVEESRCSAITDNRYTPPSFPFLESKLDLPLSILCPVHDYLLCVSEI